jgi:hypothetical protein
MIVVEKEEYEIPEGFEEAIAPLVKYLVRFPVNHPVHNNVLADLYDRINDIRDEAVSKARQSIAKLRMSSDFMSDRAKKSEVLRLQSLIRHCQGVGDGANY